MDLSSVLLQIKNDNIEEFERVLKKYNQENCRTFTFDRKEEDNRIVLCQGLLSVLQRQVPPECQRTCLESLRILSRDKRVLSPVATRSGVLLLARLAGLGVGEATADSPEGGNAEEEVVAVEALKCLCNLVFNSPEAQRVSADLQLARGLCARLRAAGGPQRHQVELFSLRLIFLLSALDPGVRATLQQELCAVGLLTSVLERTLDLCWVGPYEVAPPDPSAPPIPAEENERVMEALKALFNLTLCDITDEDGVHQFRLISGVMRHLLMLKTLTEDKTEEVHSHAVNLLSNIPAPCLDVLVDVPVRGGSEGHDGKNMEAVQALLAFMERRIDKGTNYKEGLTPVLSLLTASSRCHREIRRYIKAQVLPPLTDVMSRPEVGDAVRNKLVRLMTHVDMGVKQSAAEFLFVLCKESVDNLLKYTGYGNAAGLLMARGLLGGGRGEGEYSEDEDSDTEEYKSARPFINPITGHVEEPAPNPFEEMTEEQKEIEAEKLVTMFDKLSRQELIRPMGVRRDGSLVPLEDAVSQCTVDSGSESD